MGPFLLLATAALGTARAASCAGLDGPACTEQAAAWRDGLAQACRLGSATACTLLARRYRTGSVRASPTLAGLRADQACAMGDPVGCLLAPNAPSVQVDAVARDYEPPLSLAVVVGVDGLLVQAAELDLTYAQVVPTLACATAPCRTADDYPWPALREALLAVKRAHPDEESVVVAAEAGAPAPAVLRAMEVVGCGSFWSPWPTLFPDCVVAGGER